MAITFTKKASEEMKKRLAKMIGKDKTNKVAMGTTHSIFYRLLKALDKDYAKLKIMPDWWKFGLLNDMTKDYDSKKNPHGLAINLQAGELASFISYQKANAVEVADGVMIDENVDYVDGVDKAVLQQAYALYESVRKSSRQIDFDDILFDMYRKLKSDEKFRKQLQKQYSHVMIDEFQDTSLIVTAIVKMINDTNVFVVGDFRQSIYKFINARVENILNFKDEFKDTKLIELNKNFRSTQNIVGLSNKIIANSEIEKYKEYKPSESVAEIGEPIQFSLYNDELEQISSIASKIEEMHANGTPLKEIAILVRTNAQTASIEEIFAERDLPYDVSKATSFFDRKEILDILSYARLAVDRQDDASFRRIYNTPNRYLSKTFVQELETFASDRDMSLYNAVRVTPHNGEWKYKRNIDALTKTVDDLITQAQMGVNAGRLLRNVIKSTKYIQYVNDTATSASSADEKNESIEKLCEMASKFPNIKAFLAHIVSIQDKQKKAKGKDAVQVTTSHSSKGLEWDVVFVINANKGLIPHEKNTDVEEERRLFYVSCSRPRNKLYISWYFYNTDMEIQKEGLFVEELLGKETTDEMKKELFRGSREAVHNYSI